MCLAGALFCLQQYFLRVKKSLGHHYLALHHGRAYERGIKFQRMLYFELLGNRNYFVSTYENWK